jgi:transposase-like protein
MNTDAIGALPALTTCEQCGASGLEQIRVPWSDAANFLCHRCGTCWYVQDGEVRRRDPLTCPGCSRRRVCLAALGERSP